MNERTKNHEWDLLMVLPNLKLDKPFGTDLLAIVPLKDDRIGKIIRGNAASKSLLTRFETQRGDTVEPSALIRRRDFPKALDEYDHILGFRNVIAVSCLVRTWTSWDWGAQMLSPAYSDYFDFYPVTPGRNGSLMVNNPALLSYGEPSKFRGQTSAYLGESMFPPQPDNDLLKPLLHKWGQIALRLKQETWSDRALLRSLDIAYRAMSLPGTVLPTILEYGTRIGLWCSAFETLFHPGPGKEISAAKVKSRLARYPWQRRRLRRQAFIVKRLKKKPDVERGNLGQAIYQQLWDARNDFLHGEPIGLGHLHVFRKRNRHPLTAVAPILYRAALCVFLDLPYPRQDKYSDFGQYFASFNLWESYEEALLKCLSAKLTKGRS